MKKLLFVLFAFTMLSTVVKSQDKAASFNYYAVNVDDTIVSADSVIVKRGANLFIPFDTLAALVIKLPTTAPHDGALFHITITQKVVALTYNTASTVNLPNAIEIVEPVTKTGLNGKRICVGGSFSIIYSARRGKWYRCE